MLIGECKAQRYVLTRSGSAYSSDGGGSRRLSLALVIGLLVCCALPIIILSAGVGITSYFVLHKSDILIYMASIILILVAFGVLVWIFRHRGLHGNERESKLTDKLLGQTTKQAAATKLNDENHCCEGESKSN